ncbi:MAG: ferritin [Deltaproteobacteria bacterium]|nr:ferritin [Deltaproteobacteria bacterium]
MISQRLQDAMNEQMKNEFFSAYLYKAMEAYFEQEELKGFANWIHVQALEELTHGERFFRFLCDVGGKAVALGIDAPKGDFRSVLEAFEYGLSHEQFVTSRINQLMDLAREESNHAAQIMLQWFVTEQVEEESNFTNMVKKLKIVEGDGRGLLLLDQEAAQRVFTPPAATGEGAA